MNRNGGDKIRNVAGEKMKLKNQEKAVKEWREIVIIF